MGGDSPKPFSLESWLDSVAPIATSQTAIPHPRLSWTSVLASASFQSGGILACRVRGVAPWVEEGGDTCLHDDAGWASSRVAVVAGHESVHHDHGPACEGVAWVDEVVRTLQDPLAVDTHEVEVVRLEAGHLGAQLRCSETEVPWHVMPDERATAAHEEDSRGRRCSRTAPCESSSGAPAVENAAADRTAEVVAVPNSVRQGAVAYHSEAVAVRTGTPAGLSAPATGQRRTG